MFYMFMIMMTRIILLIIRLYDEFETAVVLDGP